jgi:hypothetical protein
MAMRIRKEMDEKTSERAMQLISDPVRFLETNGPSLRFPGAKGSGEGRIGGIWTVIDDWIRWGISANESAHDLALVVATSFPRMSVALASDLIRERSPPGNLLAAQRADGAIGLSVHIAKLNVLRRYAEGDGGNDSEALYGPPTDADVRLTNWLRDGGPVR